MSSKLINVLETVQQQREELRNLVKGVLSEGIQQFMKEHPSIKAIGWAQYTPYFNDGDTCEFSIHGFFASSEDERSESLYDEGWHEVYDWAGKKIPEGFSATDWVDIVNLTKLLNDAEEDLKYAFGDHVTVIVTQNGIDVEEYEHD